MQIWGFGVWGSNTDQKPLPPKLVPSDFNVAARLKHVINKYGLKEIHTDGPASAYLTAAITAQDIRPCFERRQAHLPPARAGALLAVCRPLFPGQPVTATETWRRLQEYLLTPSGREKMEASKSR